MSTPLPRAEQLRRDAIGRVDLKSYDLPGLIALFAEHGEPEIRARKAFQHLWQDGVRAVEEMVDVAAVARKKIASFGYISFLEPSLVLLSADGSRKILWRCEDGSAIESVLIPDGDRLTLCVSSQVGCAMACTFCLTGDLGLKRHLKAAEIANQVLQTQLQLPDGTRITNLVMMGMGEPLHNLDNLVPALNVCLDDFGLKLSHRRITVSTVGLVPKMAELAARLPVNLAVSFNATTEAQRREIMPITRKHSMAELLEACRNFPLPNGKRITFEYVMLAGFNDADDDADRLFDLLQGIPAKVNLIPYNENPDRDLRRPSDERVKTFQDRLVRRGLSTAIRTTRGLDVSAACGQLGKAAQQAEDRGWLHDARVRVGFEDAGAPAVGL